MPQRKRPCRAEDLDNNLDLDVETWSGRAASECDGALACDIDDQADVRHFVKILNRKTIKLEVHVHGFIAEGQDHVRFDGPPGVVSNETAWSMVKTVYRHPNDVECFDEVRIVKKSNGQATLRVKVHYDDPWETGRVIDDPDRPLLFGIRLVSSASAMPQ